MLFLYLNPSSRRSAVAQYFTVLLTFMLLKHMHFPLIILRDPGQKLCFTKREIHYPVMLAFGCFVM